jgi:hypothetical protein
VWTAPNKCLQPISVKFAAGDFLKTKNEEVVGGVFEEALNRILILLLRSASQLVGLPDAESDLVGYRLSSSLASSGRMVIVATTVKGERRPGQVGAGENRNIGSAGVN